MQVEWISTDEAMPDEGKVIYIQGVGFMAQAYYLAGMYWQDANKPTCRYPIASVIEWAEVPQEDDIDQQQKIEALEQYMSVAQHLIVQMGERIESLKRDLEKQKTQVVFHEYPKEILRIVPTEKGFDIVIAEGVETTEAVEVFIDAVRRRINTGV
jgi:hypothetical protein